MIASTRRAGSLLRTAMVGAMLLLPAGTAHGARVATFQTYTGTGPIIDVSASQAGLVAARQSDEWGENATITSYKYDGTERWSASVPSSLLGSGSLDRVAPAADGSVWFSASDGIATLGRVTTTRQVAAVTIPGSRDVQTITATPDGRVFAVVDNQLRQLNADGTAGSPIVTISQAQDLRSGPDGSVWWIDGRTVGSVSSTGQVATFPVPFWAESVSADGRGHAWFGAPGEIARLDTATGAVSRFAGPDTSGQVAVDHLATGVDGTTWFTSRELALYGRIGDTGGILTWDITEQVPSFASPTSLALGTDGNVWFGSRAHDGGPGYHYLTLLQRVDVVAGLATADDNRPRPSTPGTGAPGTGSNGANVPKPSPTPAPGTGALSPAIKKLKMSRGVIRLPMQCVGGVCQAEVTVSAKIGRSKGVVIASKKVNTQAGKTVKLGLRLSRPGLKVVRKAGKKGLGVLVNVTVGGKTTRHRLVIKR